MKLVHRMVYRMLPGPLVGWLATLMFLLLMQFLIRYLPDLVGKGLTVGVVAELVVYNLAYMVVLAVPMSVLIATMMTYGKLGETHAFLVLKSAGVSVGQLLGPGIVVGVLLVGGMLFFNNFTLPESNFRAKTLWLDIRKKKPDFELQPGVFYEGIANYSILVGDVRREANELREVLVYDYTQGPNRRIDITAQRGRIVPVPGGTALDLLLENGESHQRHPKSAASAPERYERTAFARYRLRLDLSDFVFERSSPRESTRSDRTMPTPAMMVVVDSLDASVARRQAGLLAASRAALSDSALRPTPYRELPSRLPGTTWEAADTLLLATDRVLLDGVTVAEGRRIYAEAQQQARQLRTQIDNAVRSVKWERQRADRYRVEIHKKFSIATACLIFVLIGAPLGLAIRRGNLATMGALATAIFIFYWVTLVQGEKLADRGHLAPWIGMWGANAVMGLLAIGLFVYVIMDLKATPPLWKRLRRRFQR